MTEHQESLQTQIVAHKRECDEAQAAAALVSALLTALCSPRFARRALLTASHSISSMRKEHRMRSKRSNATMSPTCLLPLSPSLTLVASHPAILRLSPRLHHRLTTTVYPQDRQAACRATERLNTAQAEARVEYAVHECKHAYSMHSSELARR